MKALARLPLRGLVVIAVVLVGVPFLHIGFLTATMLVVALNAIAALGLALLVGTAGEVSVAQAAFVGIGAYTAAITAKAGLNPWLAILAAVLMCGIVATIVGLPTLRLRGHYLTLATLGLGVIATVVFNESGVTGGPSGFGDFHTLHLGTFELAGDVPIYVLAWLVVGIGAVIIAAVNTSSRGRALRAIAASEAAAAAMGVRVRLRKLEAFALSAMFAAVSGALYAFYVGYISPSSFTFEQSVYLLVMVVLGGARTILGPIFGAAIYSLVAGGLTQLASVAFPSSAQSAAAALQTLMFGLILIVVMRFVPGGIVGAFAVRAKNNG